MQKNNSPLQTDLYQLTMGYGYWKQGMAEREAVFHLYFRKAPFGEQAAIVAGLADALEWVKEFSFTAEELEYLAGLQGNDAKPLFENAYLDYLKNLKLSCDIWAIEEGELAYPKEPMIRVQGPLIQCQLLETALLNIVNFQTLVATQSARVCAAAEGDAVLEFGLRRAQGPDGGLSASRAAYIGGCVATSNVQAGYHYGIPVKGTHAHSWVMSFDDELEAFESYAEVMPNNTVLLVDTYDTAEGVEKAIVVAKQLREKGHELSGIRLDSGDLCELSLIARKRLDEEGFPDANVVASNDLNVETIRELKAKGAMINVWGVGTKLVTAYEQPALGGVYKLGALRDDKGKWQWKAKKSNDAIKVSIPGILQVRETEQGREIFHDPEADTEGILKPVVRQGKGIIEPSPLEKIRTRAMLNWKKTHQKCLLIVDVQNDFLPGGALAVSGGDEIVSTINTMMDDYDFVVATKDWHPNEHGSFAANHDGVSAYEMGKLGELDQCFWPVHCVQGSDGAEFSTALNQKKIDAIVTKGEDPSVDSYSGFFDNGKLKSTGLTELLRKHEVSEVHVVGLALDYCVKFTALDAITEGFQTTLISAACRAVNLQQGDDVKAIETMREKGVIIR